MHLVTLECRDCEKTVDVPTDYMADEKPDHLDMQLYFNRNYLAQCWDCADCNWDVVDIKPAVCPHGHLDIVV